MIRETACAHILQESNDQENVLGRGNSFPSGSAVKNLSAVQDTQETQVQSLSWEDALEKEMATHSSSLAWRTPWTEDFGGLQSMGSQRAGHDRVTKQQQE